MPNVIPFGDRILVERRKIGDKLGTGILHASDETKDRPTDLADVVFVPEHSFADKKLIERSESIIDSLLKKAEEGDAEAFVAILQFNAFLKLKMVQVGDAVMISKYVGTDFFEKGSSKQLTLVKGEDIIGLVTQ